jgi:hypothetical protein
VKRFLKPLAFLMVSLVCIASGLDVALDRLSDSPTQSSLTVYNEQGTVVLAYSGDLRACKAYAKPAVIVPTFLHRT